MSAVELHHWSKPFTVDTFPPKFSFTFPTHKLPAHSLTIALVLLFAVTILTHRVFSILSRPKPSQTSIYPARRLPQLDPLFGLDTIISSYDALRTHSFLSIAAQRFRSAGNTYAARMLGSDLLATCEPDNVKALLATQFEDFGLGVRRKTAFQPLLGHGIFASDGPEWKTARTHLRPSFARDRVSDMSAFQRHADLLIQQIHAAQAQHDGGEVELQRLFFRLSLDVATEFFFGESCGSLSSVDAASDAADFADAFNRSQQTLVDDFVLGPVANSVPHFQFRRDQKTVFAFAQGYVEKALARVAEMEETEGETGRPTSILDDMARQISDPVQLRDQALSLLVAGRDTTASLLSNLWFILAQRPDVWTRLQEEVQSLDGKMPEMGELKDLKYLQSCLKESLRLHPPVPVNIRQAVQNTTLPRGGGEDGKSPIYIPSGTIVSYCVYAMHRREDLWGSDADEFRPERWDGRKTGWEFLPFNGGSRICLGQQLALAEAGFVTVRVLQEFSRIGTKEVRPWAEHLSLTCCVEGGVNVTLGKRATG